MFQQNRFGFMRLYIGLIHYPVYDRNRRTIASAITTLDLHDMARLARTYDVERFFVITPLEDQQSLAERVFRHWTEGYGAHYNRHRKEAMERMEVVPTLDRALVRIRENEGGRALVMATDAARQENRLLSFGRARDMVAGDRPVLVIFGTAWGLEQEVLKAADYVLEPISGRGDYNHLSVRSAAAIVLDRLVGRSY